MGSIKIFYYTLLGMAAWEDSVNSGRCILGPGGHL